MVSFHQVSQPKSCMHLSCPLCATCPAHLILHDLMNGTFGEEYRSWSSSLCSLLHTTVTSSLFSPDIFLSHLSSNTLCLCMYVCMYVCIYARSCTHTHTQPPGRNKIGRQDGSIPRMPHKAVPWPMQSVSSQRHRLYPWPVHVEFVVLQLH